MPINATSLAAAAPSVNLVLLTVRHNQLACEIIDAGLRATVAYPGVRFSLAYGGVDTAHGQWLTAQCAAAQAQGGDVRLMQEVDTLVRMQWASESTQDWVLFMSDDDPFSVNHIGSLMRRAATVGPEVAIVAPLVYVAVTPSRTLTRRVEPMAGRVADRLARFEARADLKPMLFYAFHRRENVRAWLAQLAKMPYTPTYCDNLLTTRSILQGELAVTDEPSIMVRDEAHWEGLDACTRSDARCYPDPAMVVFHELFWAADTIQLFTVHPEFASLQPELKQWMLIMLTNQLRSFERRRELLGIALDGEVADMVRAVLKVVQWLQSVAPGESFGAGLSSVEALAAEIQRSLLERLAVAKANDTTCEIAGEALPA